MLSGLGIALAVTCIVFIAYALLVTYSSVTEKYTVLVVVATAVVSVVVAGFDTAKAAADKGWMWGMCSGFLYALVILIVGAFVGKGLAFNLSMVTTLVISLAGGGLGGIFGINAKGRKN